MIDTLIIYMHSKRVLYVHVFYLLFSLDFIGRFQHAAANDTHILEALSGAGVSAVLFKPGRHVPQIKRLVTFKWLTCIGSILKSSVCFRL